MYRRTFLHYLATGAALALGAGVSRQSAHATEAKGDFFMLDFPNLQGQGTALKNYVGQPLVVNFWATWCPPCVKEMPDLDRLSQQYPDVDRKSTRLNSSHVANSYAVFCLKKKNKYKQVKIQT